MSLRYRRQLQGIRSLQSSRARCSVNEQFRWPVDQLQNAKDQH
jgi:hypothetical protein